MSRESYVEEWYRKSEKGLRHQMFLAPLISLLLLITYIVLGLIFRISSAIFSGIMFSSLFTASNLLSIRLRIRKYREIAETLSIIAKMFDIDTSTCIEISKILRYRRGSEPLPSRRYRLVCYGGEPIGIIDNEDIYYDIEDLAKYLKKTFRGG